MQNKLFVSVEEMDQRTPMEKLGDLKNEVSLESFNVMAFPGVFRNLANDVFNAFKFTEMLTDVPKVIPLPKDQAKFLKVIEAIPYSEIGELKAYTPEGMSCTYLEFLEQLEPVTMYLQTLQSNVVSPFVMFLAQFVSDKKMSTTTNHMKQEYVKMEAHRELIYKNFSKLYTKNSYKAESQVKKVISRNNDWKLVLLNMNRCIANLESIDRESIKREVKQATDYIELIVNEFSHNPDRKASEEAAQRLANGCYSVAKELELLSTTYYRALALRGGIENTMEHIKKVYS